MNGKGNHVLLLSALELSIFKKCTYVKKIFCCNIYIYMYIYIYIYIYIYLAIIVNISIIIIIFLFLKFIYSRL